MKDLNEVALVMKPEMDSVAVAISDLNAGDQFQYNGNVIHITESVRKGHRLAIKKIPAGEYVLQYGQPFARSMGIECGAKVGMENTLPELPEVDNSDFIAPPPTKILEKWSAKTFMGYNRPDGKTGTRNYYLVLPTSMCVSETARQLAFEIENSPEFANNYSNVDGVISTPHSEGCGCDHTRQIDRFLRILKGFVLHPNVGGVLIMDLGCEQTNYRKVHQYLQDDLKHTWKPVDWITVQESGGIQDTVNIAKEKVFARLASVNNVKREPCSIGKLIVGTECGASDSFSGITANPLVGNVADKVIYAGGSAILTEVPELVGIYEMFYRRFRSRSVAEKFKACLDWYQKLADSLGLSMKGNLVPKNIEGGLFNNFIKSLGGAMKGGTTPIEDVVDYGEKVCAPGLNIMQGPGSDLESVTGLASCGAQVILFTTGQGTVTGSAICPVLKIASNSATFEKLSRDMDYNGGDLLRRGETIDHLGDDLLEKMIRVCSGEKTWSEKWKQRQFQVWTAGKLSL